MRALIIERASALTILCSSLFMAGAAVAQVDGAGQEFFSRIRATASALAGKSGDEALAGCTGLVRELLDLDQVARRAAGDVWQRMSEAQRTAYGAALQRGAARRCVEENRRSSGEAVILLGMRRAEDGDRLLATRQGADSRTLIWRLPANAGERRLRAVDLMVDGRSTVLTLRDETAASLQRANGNIDAMIEALGR